MAYAEALQQIEVIKSLETELKGLRTWEHRLSSASRGKVYYQLTDGGASDASLQILRVWLRATQEKIKEITEQLDVAKAAFDGFEVPTTIKKEDTQ